MAKRGRPRKKMPPKRVLARLRRRGIPWKLIEHATGVSERTIRRRVILPPQAGCNVGAMTA